MQFEKKFEPLAVHVLIRDPLRGGVGPDRCSSMHELYVLSKDFAFLIMDNINITFLGPLKGLPLN